MTVALVILVVVVFLLVLFLIGALKVAREYERAIVFRLGRLFPEPKGPGLFFLIPIVDRMVKVDLRTITLQIPPQEVITKDNVPVRVNAVAYFRIVDPKAAIVQVENYMVATSQKSHRRRCAPCSASTHSTSCCRSARRSTRSCRGSSTRQPRRGASRSRMSRFKDVEIPQGMQRAMARQAEAERERRAKVINAEGEYQASERLKDAALVIDRPPDRAAAPLPADAARARLVAVDDDRLPGAGRRPGVLPAAIR